jgi:glycosyltransferase involved in cell wall biosynthesis
VLDQAGVDVRVLVIDDCSPDDTAEVGRALAAEDSRVTFWRHETNKGHIATYNEGIEWADGDYFLLISADDLATPGALTRAAAVMDAHPNVSMTYGKFFKLKNDDALQAFEAPAEPRVKITPGMEFFEMICRSGENIVPTPTAIVRTRIQKLVGGYNAALPHAGDMEMWLRFAAHGDVAHLDVEQAYYRFHTSNMHRPFMNNPRRDLSQRKLTFAYVFDTLSDRLANAAALRETAAKGLAQQAFWIAAELFDQGDVERCDEVLEFSIETDPALRNSKDFKKLQFKRRLGAKTWGIVMPLVRQLRRKQPATA